MPMFSNSYQLASEAAPHFCLSPISAFGDVSGLRRCRGRKQMLLESSSFVVIRMVSGKERFAASCWAAARSPCMGLPSLHDSGSGGRNSSFLPYRFPPFWLIARASTGAAQDTKFSRDVDNKDDTRVLRVHTIKQFKEALSGAKSKLVVVEYAATHSINSKRIYPSMVELSQTCQDVIFLLVMGNESEETKELCLRAGVEKVPHFIFYKSSEVIHQEKGILPHQLLGDVLYYGDTDAPIKFLHSRKDVEALLAKHASDSKLIVLDVGLRHCGPCVKIYPTFVKLAKKMRDSTVFARMNGDENQDCMQLLKQMGVVEVPTFLFIRNSNLCGRYVGSGKGELIGEVLRYQGVRVTY